MTLLKIVVAAIGLTHTVTPRPAPVPTAMVERAAEAAPLPRVNASADALPDVAAKVVECESSNRNVANREGSPATGFYQALDATWVEVMGLAAPAMAWPREVQDRFFAKLWREPGGWQHWAASRWCWADW